MAGHLLRRDGLFVGSSAAVNCVGAVKAARSLGPGHTVVTVGLRAFSLPESAQAVLRLARSLVACTAARQLSALRMLRFQ